MCPGPYIVPTPLALRMAVLATYTRFLWLDDVWATGLVGLLAGAKHVPLSHEPLSPYDVTVQHQGCFYDLPPPQAPTNSTSKAAASRFGRKPNVSSLYKDTWRRLAMFGTSGHPPPVLPC